jgi:hypothetical protein
LFYPNDPPEIITSIHWQWCFLTPPQGPSPTLV